MSKLRSIRLFALGGGLAIACLLLPAAAEATHPRPHGATPLRFSLVPAYAQCTTPNRTHGPPLAFPSCQPPAQTSAQATVGTPDANGGTANFSGSMTFHVIVGPPGPPDDSDVRVLIDMQDVRCVPTGARCGSANAAGPADYSGEMGFSFSIRNMTDHYNAVAPGGGPDAATVQPTISYSDTFPCLGTASTSTGSSCSIHASALAIVAGSVKDGKRAVWDITDAKVDDGGADGDADTLGDNALFLQPGIFIP
jgi:hypothetical protein